jgi:hypothetical protein
MQPWRDAIAVLKNQFHLARIHIARPDARLSQTILGLVTGIVTGSVIVLFRYAIDGLPISLVPERQIGDFEALPVEMRLLLPVAGAVLIALIFRLIGGKQRIVGVVHVLERLEYHQGRVTFRSLTLQLIGAVTAMDKSFATTSSVISRTGAGSVLKQNPSWILVTRDRQPVSAIPALDLERALQGSEETELDLLGLPAKRLSLIGIPTSATVEQALDRLKSEGAEALYFYNANIPALSRIQGIVTREALRSSFRYCVLRHRAAIDNHSHSY